MMVKLHGDSVDPAREVLEESTEGTVLAESISV